MSGGRIGSSSSTFVSGFSGTSTFDTFASGTFAFATSAFDTLVPNVSTFGASSSGTFVPNVSTFGASSSGTFVPNVSTFGISSSGTFVSNVPAVGASSSDSSSSCPPIWNPSIMSSKLSCPAICSSSASDTIPIPSLPASNRALSSSVSNAFKTNSSTSPSSTESSMAPGFDSCSAPVPETSGFVSPTNSATEIAKSELKASPTVELSHCSPSAGSTTEIARPESSASSASSSISNSGSGKSSSKSGSMSIFGAFRLGSTTSYSDTASIWAMAPSNSDKSSVLPSSSAKRSTRLDMSSVSR